MEDEMSWVIEAIPSTEYATIEFLHFFTNDVVHNQLFTGIDRLGNGWQSSSQREIPHVENGPSNCRAAEFNVEQPLRRMIDALFFHGSYHRRSVFGKPTMGVGVTIVPRSNVLDRLKKLREIFRLRLVVDLQTHDDCVILESFDEAIPVSSVSVKRKPAAMWELELTTEDIYSIMGLVIKLE